MVAAPVELKSLESKTVPLMVRVPASELSSSSSGFTVQVAEAATDRPHAIERKATFTAPEKGGGGIL
jgi:hypothetical protein